MITSGIQILCPRAPKNPPCAASFKGQRACPQSLSLPPFEPIMHGSSTKFAYSISGVSITDYKLHYMYSMSAVIQAVTFHLAHTVLAHTFLRSFFPVGCALFAPLLCSDTMLHNCFYSNKQHL